MTERDASIHLDLPFYRQHWDFTCGPASLMMAMKYLDDGVRLDRDLEIDVWREANLVAARGTSRYGLAYAAAVRGFSARATSTTSGIDFPERLVPLLDPPDMELLGSSSSSEEPGAGGWASGSDRRRSRQHHPQIAAAEPCPADRHKCPVLR